MVGRRQVFYVAGFDPIDAPAQHRRFRREAEKFSRIWSVTTEVSDMDAQTGAGAGRWKILARGPNWTTETDFELLDWQDIVRKEIARPALAHLVEGMIAFGDFLFSGTAVRYFRAAWPYGTFFAAPFLNVLLFTALAVGAGVGAAQALVKYGDAVAAVAGIAVGLAVFLLLMRTLGRRWRVRQALADWVFAREFMYGRRPEMEARLEEFAQRIVASATRDSYDELVIVGHSLGATMAVLALRRALDLDTNLTRHNPKIGLLTIGSTIPKLALHPAAGALRDCGTRVASEPAIAWTEFQARRDVISFYKFDPVTLERFQGNVAGRKPHIRLIGMKDLLTTETYNRNWLRQMRLHYQFVMANERRAQYDYFMFVCGPVAFSQLSEAPDGPLDLFGAYGSLLASAGRVS